MNGITTNIKNHDELINIVSAEIAKFTKLEEFNVMTSCVIDGDVVVVTEYEVYPPENKARLELAAKAYDYASLIREKAVY
jgi:hypothetical protein